MMDRGQSQVIGTVLLTVIIALSVSATGAVVLTDWEADIDEGPVSDLDSEVTPINLTLDHRGGATLYPENTTIHLLNVEENTSLEAQFQPGDTLFEEFDRLDGTVEVVVVHEPSNSRIYSETHQIDNDVEGLLFEVDDRTEPAYVVEGYAANYTVGREYELGVPENVTREANVTVDDESFATVDDGNTTITGATPGRVNTQAEIDDDTVATDLVVLQNSPVLNLTTHNATTTGPTSIEAKGELTDLGRLPEVDLLFETVPHRAFNRDADDNGDNVTASGEWRTDPAGYAHGGRHVNDNRPLVPGETRTYYYNNSANLNGRFLWYLRNDEDFGYVRNDYYRGGFYYGDWPNGEYRIEVTLSEDGSTVDVVTYSDATGDNIYREETGLSARSDVYFSTYGGGTTGNDSIRLTGIYEPSQARFTEVETDVTDEGNYSAEITGLNVDQTYSVHAYGRTEIGEATVTARGERLTTATESQTVETVSAVPAGGTRINATGRLVDIGDLRQTDLLFNYTPHRAFNRDADDNGDNVTAVGEWRTDPAGYAHGGRYVNDNEPLVPGETRTYYYNNSANINGRFLWYLRNDEDSGYVRNEYYRGGYYYGGWPNGELRIEVTLSEDGSTVDVISYSDATGDNVYRSETDVSTRSGDVYFSTYTGGTSGEDSIRLTDIYDTAETQQVEAETDVTGPTTYSTNITGLGPERYYSVRAYAEEVVNGTVVSDTGRRHTTYINGPSIQTLRVNATGGTSIEAEGELVDIGDLRQTDLLFNYTPHRAFNRDADDNGDNVTAVGEWRTDPAGYAHGGRHVNDNEPLVPGETRTYYYNNSANLNGRFLWYLRHDEDFGYVRNDYYRGGFYYGDWPNGEYRIEVTLSEDGSTVTVVTYSDATGDNIYDSETVSARSGDVYFSTYGGGTSGPDSIRLTDIRDTAETEQVEVETDVTGPTTYSTNITDLGPERDYSVRAYTEEVVNGTVISDTGGRHTTYINGPSVETLRATPTGGTSIEAEGELVDIGDLRQTDLWFEATPYRVFNEDSEDSGDNVTASGEWRTDPAGYAHGGRHVNDNRPLVPGETRTYYYNNSANLNGRFLWYLRNDEDFGYVRNDYYRGGFYYGDWPNGEYRIEVTLSEDGSTVDVVTYSDATGDNVYDSETGLSASRDVYFSTYGGGTSGEDSIRLTGIYEPSNAEQYEVETGVTNSTTYSTEIGNLDPDRTYDIRAYSERTVDNVTITDSGAEVAAATETATIETLSAQPTGNRIEAEGELVDLGTLQQTDLWFETTPYREFTEDADDNGDNVTASGEWRTDPAGYAHGGRHVNDNRPLVPGETRTYYYNNSANLNGRFLWYLRNDEDFGYVRNEYYRGGYYYGDWPNGEYRIEVTLSEDGSTVDVVTYSDATGDNVYDSETGLSASRDVYFSTYGGGTSGEDSIRLTGIYEPSNAEQYEVETGVTNSTTYSTDIVAELEREYAVRAFAEREVDNTTIVNTGDEIDVETGSPGGP